MDRILTVEHPPLALTNTGTAYTMAATGFRQLDPTAYVHEATIDLGGYTRKDDMTVFFRNSFQQRGGYDVVGWDVYDPNSDAISEQVIISSVPFTDEQLITTALYAPGFIPGGIPGIDFGNFDRTHIIHGEFKVWYANAIVGAGAFSGRGFATLTSLVDNVYSSLEPTAADTLYCYRVIFVPIPADTQITGITLAPMRVLMSITTEEEPELSYMMRLKRSYELANQV
tara:strand:- start:1844 stop:2524 length:681 start_codon:yes stop_codon:yes gene_type:complete